MRNPKTEFFFEKEGQWKQAYQELRAIVLDCGLQEELKWGVPCYTYEETNVVLIHGFKKYCALLFMKGVLLNDEHQLLIQQTANVQAARQIRFQKLSDIQRLTAEIKSYIYEAIEVEKAGLQVELKTTAEFDMPEEFKVRIMQDQSLKSAFEALTPGRQRAYLLHFSGAKQSKTRTSRIEKSIPKIREGKGLNDN